ncbi:hypothetical protein AYI70_g2814 [Smittium culicis]|uniref:Uncharacterized protein n=1 Tax=Smittium culicis TaxID=133412 RepID=A0A1R1Y6I3_9FUNG|nr:hypothetical protein AYI70_g2814 [Smittium culicis]
MDGWDLICLLSSNNFVAVHKRGFILSFFEFGINLFKLFDQLLNTLKEISGHSNGSILELIMQGFSSISPPYFSFGATKTRFGSH